MRITLQCYNQKMLKAIHGSIYPALFLIELSCEKNAMAFRFTCIIFVATEAFLILYHGEVIKICKYLE